ncbi:MAG: biotin carboxylase N-terminal domain-containing protein [Pseudomonadota bacterium]
MFSKILIANRGEIACRIARTCSEMGIATVAVYSSVDAAALHVRMCNEAVHIGPAPSKDSYLNIENILAAAIETEAEAIHPGYGFLSENPRLVEACADSGIVFIGPSAENITAMGSKSQAKATMAAAGVPVLPGYEGEDQDDQVLLRAAEKTGFPVLIKAVSGGGGKGMRVVDHADAFLDALASVRREALSSFADDRVLIEQFLPAARHVEVQVFGDSLGNVVHLHERDCTLQRRHQKVIEEAPAPGLRDDTREALHRAGVAAASAIAYQGAGTVEFLLGPDEQFYFMEMNTRLQVEHPVTEMITGTDLVAWQIRIAAGEPLPLQQEDIVALGSAMEARVYAESPSNQFLPSTGALTVFNGPDTGEHCRLDSGVQQGDELSPYYDPMIAKLITFGGTREKARVRLQHALTQIDIVGIDHNVSFLHRLLDLSEFRSGEISDGYHTEVIAEKLASILSDNNNIPAALIAVAMLKASASATDRDDDVWYPRDHIVGWRLNMHSDRIVELEHNESRYIITVRDTPKGMRVSVGDDSFELKLIAISGQSLSFRTGVVSFTMRYYAFENGISIHCDGTTEFIRFVDRSSGDEDETGVDSDLEAPMPGIIIAVNVTAGDTVECGQVLMVMEAMKMEHSITAPRAGTVVEVFYGVGEQVMQGTPVLILSDSDADE